MSAEPERVTAGRLGDTGASVDSSGSRDSGESSGSGDSGESGSD
jgi:hypothetical protein